MNEPLLVIKNGHAKGRAKDEEIQDFKVERYHDPACAAEKLAKIDLESDGYELYDPKYWPRTYEVLTDQGWIAFSVELDYDPSFSASRIKEGGDQ